MFYLPPAIKKIMLICGIVFLLQQTLGDGFAFVFNNYLALHSVYSEYFSAYQLLTYAFLHADFSHILLNLLGLWVFGSRIELLLGSRKFVNFVLFAAVGSALFHLGFLFFNQKSTYILAQYNDYLYRFLNVPTMGISGVVFACMAAFAYLYPNDYVYVYFIIPIQVKWLVLILIGYEVFDLIQELIQQWNNNGDFQIAHFAHLGGALVGYAWIYFHKHIRKIF